MARETSDLFSDEASDVALHEAAYDAAITAAYSGTGGLERTLADLARDYAHDEADELALQMSELSNVNSPSWGVWADWAEAQADLAEEHLLKPLADALHDRRVDEAVAYTTARDASNAAARDEWLADVGAEATLGVTSAAADAGAAGESLTAEDINLPAETEPPTIETGVLPYVDSYATFPDSLMAAPGRWYVGYFGDHATWYTGGLYIHPLAPQSQLYHTAWSGGFLLDYIDDAPAYYGSWQNTIRNSVSGGQFSTLTIPTAAEIYPGAIVADPNVNPDQDVEDANKAVGAIVQTVIDAAAELLLSNDLTPVQFDLLSNIVTLGDTVLSFAAAANSAAQIVARNADMQPSTGLPGWDERGLYQTIQRLDPFAAEFMAKYVRLSLASNGNAEPSYRLYAADQLGRPQLGIDPSENFRDILAGRAKFALEIEVPAHFNNLQAAEYYLGVLTGSRPNASSWNRLFYWGDRHTNVEGVDATRIAKLYKEVLADSLSKGSRNISLDDAIANTRARASVAGQQSAAYADFYLEAIAGASLGGGFVMVAYKLAEVGLVAGALEMIFAVPVGGDVLQSAVKWIPIKGPGGKTVLTMVPADLVRLAQKGKARGTDEFFAAIRKAGADDDAAKKALVDFARKNAVSVLVTNEKWARQLLRDALGLAEGAPEVAHHLIPLEALKVRKLKAILEKGAHGGFDMNGVVNGIALNDTLEVVDGELVEILRHQGPHEYYNAVLMEQVEQINVNLPAEQVAQALQEIADIARMSIVNNEFLPINGWKPR